MATKINWDIMGIATSVACAIHCALLPLLLTSLPLFGINIIHNIVFLPIFKARENDTGEVSSKILADAIQKVNTSTKSLTFEEAKGYIKSLPLSSHDVIVTMGAGNAFLVGEALIVPTIAPRTL